MTSTLIFAVLIVIAPILIIVSMTRLSRYKQKRKTSDVYLQFDRIARENNLHLSESQVIKDQVLGIDGLASKFLLAQINAKNELVWEIIDLYSIKECSLYKSQDTPKNNRANKNLFYIKEMGICLHFYYDRDPINIVFYQHIVDYLHNLPGAENAAGKWKTIICRKMKNADSPGRYRALA